MKILILGTAYPLRGGIAHFNALLASHLAERHEVETITFKRQYPDFFFPGSTQQEQDAEPGLRPAPELIDSINPFNWFAVAAEVRRRAPDLIIFKYWMPFFAPCFGTIAKLAKKRTGARVLFVCDNIIPHERRIGDLALTRYAFRQADLFIVQSDAVEQELKTYFPQAVYRNVPHPVYENFGTALPKAEARRRLGIAAPRVILYFGYVRAYKGLMVLLEAMKELEGILLLAVGEFYDDETPYREYVKKWGIGDRVRFVSSYVPNQEVASYFSAADAVVLPYLSATQSGIIQIAYNFGKPVIATRVGGLAEVVLDGRTGYIVPPRDPAALAAAVKRFYGENREEVFSQNVAVEKKKYSWEHLVSVIEELYTGSGGR